MFAWDVFNQRWVTTVTEQKKLCTGNRFKNNRNPFIPISISSRLSQSLGVRYEYREAYCKG
jgi:hypothetical protein